MTSQLRSWREVAPRLVAVAAGRETADTVITGGRWVNVYSGEIIPGTTVAIADGRFAYVGPDVPGLIGEQTKVIEARGPLSRARSLRRSYACRKRHADGDGIRARGDPAWHHVHVHRSA